MSLCSLNTVWRIPSNETCDALIKQIHSYQTNLFPKYLLLMLHSSLHSQIVFINTSIEMRKEFWPICRIIYDSVVLYGISLICSWFYFSLHLKCIQSHCITRYKMVFNKHHDQSIQWLINRNAGFSQNDTSTIFVTFEEDLNYQK